jgi:hypothetical protein
VEIHADKKLEVTAGLLAHVAHNNQRYEVEASGDARWNEVTKVYEVEVKWRGLDDAEMSWELALNLFDDLTGALLKYLRARADDHVKHHGCLLPQGESVAQEAPSGPHGCDDCSDKTLTVYPAHPEKRSS